METSIEPLLMRVSRIAGDLGTPLGSEDPRLKTILGEIGRMEKEGYEYRNAEGSLSLLISRSLGCHNAPFIVANYHVSIRGSASSNICEATIKGNAGNKAFHNVAEGGGPVDALDGALRAALTPHFPLLKKIRLMDYEVHILNPKDGTAAQTRVLIQSSNDRHHWGTVGVHSNIVKASLNALTDSFECAILHR